MRTLKKTSACFLVLCLSLSLTTFAATSPTTTQSPEELYAQYQAIVEEANQTYGLDIRVLPLEEMDQTHMSSLEKFRIDVQDFCGLLTAAPTSNSQSIPATPSRRGVGAQTVPYTLTKTYFASTVYVSFSGYFDIKQNVSNAYYFSTASFADPRASSNDSTLSFTRTGALSKRLIDRNSTYQVSQTFQVTKNNDLYGPITATAYFHLNPFTGVVTANRY